MPDVGTVGGNSDGATDAKGDEQPDTNHKYANDDEHEYH